MADQLLQGEWNKTHLANEDALDKGLLEERGNFFSKEKFYMGRPVIGRDTSINGGVYVGVGREAIVVDDKKGDGILQGLYQNFLTENQPSNPDFKKTVLRRVFEFVQEKLPYNEDVVDRVAKEQIISPGEKIALTNYITAQGGVCRHQALLTGYLLEKLTNDANLGSKKLNGKVSVDRNFIPEMGGHAWVRYVNSGGEVFIIDPARDYIGSLEDARKEGGWSYDRPPAKGILGKIISRFK